MHRIKTSSPQKPAGRLSGTVSRISKILKHGQNKVPNDHSTSSLTSPFENLEGKTKNGSQKSAKHFELDASVTLASTSLDSLPSSDGEDYEDTKVSDATLTDSIDSLHIRNTSDSRSHRAAPSPPIDSILEFRSRYADSNLTSSSLNRDSCAISSPIPSDSLSDTNTLDVSTDIRSKNKKEREVGMNGIKTPKPEDRESGSLDSSDKHIWAYNEENEISTPSTRLQKMIGTLEPLRTIDETNNNNTSNEHETFVFNDEERQPWSPKAQSSPKGEQRNSALISPLLRRPCLYANSVRPTEEYINNVESDASISILKNRNIKMLEELRYLRARIEYLEAREIFYNDSRKKISGLPRVLPFGSSNIY